MEQDWAGAAGGKGSDARTYLVLFDASAVVGSCAPKNQFGWMLAGESIYSSLSKDYELMKGDFVDGPRIMFETFPHAVVCSLFGRVVSAKSKLRDRRTLLLRHGIADKAIANIDFVDAAICALTAHYVARGKWRAYGDDKSGRIVVPTSARETARLHA